jgi:hypothetical protein
VLALVCGTEQAGARYFYCEALGLSASDPCCRRAGEGAACPLRSLERSTVDCCTVITLASMPVGDHAELCAVHPAGVTAVMPAGEYVEVRPAAGLEGLARRMARWHKPPRPFSELRATLMVFLT